MKRLSDQLRACGAGVIIVLVALFFATGCDTVNKLSGGVGGAVAILDKARDTLGKVDDATVGNAAKGTSKYCQHLPGFARKKLRDHWNGRPEMEVPGTGQKARVGVWCPGDAPLVLGP